MRAPGSRCEFRRFLPRAIFGFWPRFSGRCLNRRSRVQKVAVKASVTIICQPARPRCFEQEIRYFDHGWRPAANYLTRHA